MIITRECDYSIRVIRALSSYEVVNVSNICMMENIPETFAYKICRKLERAGIIQSFRGSTGGYKLVADAAILTLYDIVSAVNKNLYISSCTNEENICSQNTNEKPCMVHREFCRIQAMLTAELKKKSILSILTEQDS